MFQNSLDLGHYEEQTLPLTKHRFDKQYFKIFFLSKDKYFSAEVTVSLTESFSSRKKNCDSTQSSLVVLGITVMDPFQKHCGLLHNSTSQYESGKRRQHTQCNGIFILSTASTT